MVGLIPLFASLVIEENVVQRLHGFRKRMDWFMENRPDIAVSSQHVLDAIPGTLSSLLSLPPPTPLPPHHTLAYSILPLISGTPTISWPSPGRSACVASSTACWMKKSSSPPMASAPCPRSTRTILSPCRRLATRYRCVTSLERAKPTCLEVSFWPA